MESLDSSSEVEMSEHRALEVSSNSPSGMHHMTTIF